MRSLDSEIELIQKEEFQTLFHPIKADKIGLIVDSKIKDFYPDIFETLSQQRENIATVVLEINQKTKSIEVYEQLTTQLLNEGLSRKSHLVCVGGGTLSDLVGFVASSIFRGINWSVVPTTILSMVDAAIGGKTGIDTDLGKNLLGAFWAPEKIYIYPEFINTLDQVEIDSGKGEILKYALLSKGICDRILEGEDLGLIMDACAQFKVEIVKKDPYESDLRKVLNLGHTFGHAYEKITKLPHGICVIWGINFMNEFFWNKEFAELIDKLIAKLEINEYHQEFNHLDLLDYIQRDKKRTSSDSIDIINLKNVGEPTIESINLSKLNDVLCCQ